MRCEMKMRGAKGFGVPGATRGVMISQLRYSAMTHAMILNEEAMPKVSICVKGVERMNAYTVAPPNGES
jgi:hypothetical protein